MNNLNREITFERKVDLYDIHVNNIKFDRSFKNKEFRSIHIAGGFIILSLRKVYKVRDN